MARVYRARTHPWTISGSTSTYLRGVFSGKTTTTVTKLSSCGDFHGSPVVPGGFSSDQYSGGGMRLSGSVKSSYASGIYGYIFDQVPKQGTQAGLDVTPMAARSGWELDLVASTNPSRPVMTPLTLMQDLIDIPKQVKQLGELIRRPRAAMTAKEAANHYLCVQFGWLPLIDDLHQLLNLQQHIAKRSAEMQKLYSGKGLRARRSIAEEARNGSGMESYALAGPSNFVDCYYDVVVHKKSWATIRWWPTTPPPFHPSDQGMNQFCRKLVLGLTVEGMAKGAWDVIPWTWLLGWFTNVGKYTLAYSNTVPAQHGTCCYMSRVHETRAAIRVKGRGTKDENLNFTGASERVQKTRIVSGAVTPGFNVPFIDTFRLSILGALFAQRTMR